MNIPATSLLSLLAMAESSRSDKKSMEKRKESLLNKVYWIRTILSVIAGIISGFLFVKGIAVLPDFIPIIFYLATISLLKVESYRNALGTRKLIYHGIGTFIVAWIVIYMLSVTLMLAS